MAQIDWSILYKKRRAVQKKYPSIWRLPVAKRHYAVMTKLKNINSMLEIGAGDRALKQWADKQWPGIEYASFDIDRNRYHDFYSLDEIDGQYDLVAMFEIIEHIRPEQAYETLLAAAQHLKPGGYIVISSPNIYYPPEFLRDATHITPWCYDELGGIIALSGFEVDQLYRIYNQSLIKQFLRRFCGYPLFRLLGIDYAKQIVAVGRKTQ